MVNIASSTKPKKKTAPTLVSTRNDLPEATRVTSIGLLNQALADLTDLHSQAKQAHWNVTGPAFFFQHELFDKVADAVFEQLDDIAERIVALGGIAEGTVRLAAANSALPEFAVEGKGAHIYVLALANRFALAAKSVRDAVGATSDAGDADTSDLLTAVSRALDKALWFLEAHFRS
ncbi:MAG: DNA starvation/stationary phase protection protein Dps [Puniceicoccales bacterium]|jgi:starvation-inducible DNA-binding protein|nr:DNA starvation/stationary phase protection protein Dps [Puniceicoccales bacterium]